MPSNSIADQLDHDATGEESRGLSLNGMVYQQLVHQNPLPIWLIDKTSHRILGCNPAAERHYGWTSYEAKQLPLEAVALEPLQNISAESGRGIASRHLTRDGTILHVETNIMPLRLEGQEAILMIVHDISHHYHLADQSAEQAALLDEATDAIVVRDLQHRILYFNRSAANIYGITNELAIGKNISELLYTNTKQFFTATQKTLIHGGWRGDMLQRHRDGRELTMASRWTLVRDAKRIPKSILEINTDISEKTKLEAQFLRAQRLESIGSLAGGIAHDLNNILAPILMAVDLLSISEEDPENQDILANIGASARRGSDIVGKILSFSRGGESPRAVLDLHPVLKDLQTVIRESFPKNIIILTEIAEPLWNISADATGIHQVLMNLCVNARDSMPDGGTLSLKLSNHCLDEFYSGMTPESKAGPHVLIEISDTGSGIPAEIQHQVFDPFFTTKPKGLGTGLGLSTVLKIVHSHGGFLNLYSEAGNGTRFSVYLPADTDSTADLLKDSSQSPPHGNGELILLVDDELSIRQVAQKTLERFGYRVITASHGAEAVQRYVTQQNDIDLIVTDMAMPVMNGYALMIAIRSMNPKAKIIACSGQGSSSDLSKAASLGIQHFISKPYSAETILQKISQILHPVGIEP